MRGGIVLLVALTSTSVSARTVIIPDPVPGPRCEVTLEHGSLGPVEAVGNGLLIQRGIENRRGLTPTSGFLFVDCKRGQAASVGEKNTLAGEADPYVISQTTTVDALMRLSNERNDDNSRLDGPPSEGALTNPYCGCAVLYPGSKGSGWVE